MRPFRPSLIAAVALVLSAGTLTARAYGAAPPAPRPLLRGTAIRRTRLSMNQAVMLAQRHFSARVVRVETQTRGGRTIYVLRMLDGAGRVFAVRVDAATGTIL
ncbi:MAG: PepSY domain-containing protein [Proteobacteria bacterium]|nr:PepSY domain-containing protein [Pseudomonadota bacterium]